MVVLIGNRGLLHFFTDRYCFCLSAIQEDAEKSYFTFLWSEEYKRRYKLVRAKSSLSHLFKLLWKRRNGTQTYDQTCEQLFGSEAKKSPNTSKTRKSRMQSCAGHRYRFFRTCIRMCSRRKTDKNDIWMIQYYSCVWSWGDGWWSVRLLNLDSDVYSDHGKSILLFFRFQFYLQQKIIRVFLHYILVLCLLIHTNCTCWKFISVI